MPLTGMESERRFLTGVPDPLLARIRALGRARRYVPGALIHAAGDPPGGLLLILHGSVRLSRTDTAGRRIVLSQLESGDTFGLFTVLTSRPRAYDAEASGAIEVSTLTRPQLDQLIASEPLIRTRVIELLSDRLSKTLEALEDERRLPLPARLAKRLLEHAGRGGEVSLTQEQLAEELGVSRYAITLALRGFLSSGLVETGYGCLRILDAAGLRAAASHQTRRTA